MLHTYWHSTTPENARSILANGFQDRCKSGLVGIPGVWVGSLPAITSIGLDQFLGHLEETWLKVEMPHSLDEFWIDDESWPGLQFLVSANIVNNGIITEVSLVDVVRYRQSVSPMFIKRLFSALEEFCPQYSLITDLELREWYRSEFGNRRLIESIERQMPIRQKYLEWLKAIAIAAPDYQEEITNMAMQALTM